MPTLNCLSQVRALRKGKILRYSALLLLVLLSFAAGYLRTGYIINLINNTYPVFLDRNSFDASAGVLSGRGLLEDPRFFSVLVYILFLISATSGSVYLLFLNLKYVRICLVIYGAAIAVNLLFFVVSVADPSSSIASGMANKMKNIIQEPFLGFLIAGYCFYEYRISISEVKK